MAFDRLGKLERGDAQEITSDTPCIQGDTPSKGNLLVICKLYKNNSDDPSHWRYWAGSKHGFESDLKLARSYKDDAAVRRQLNQINASAHAATTRERISWKSFREVE